LTAPDFAEPARGWRSWRVAETRSGLRLCSVVYDEVWEPGAALAATCRSGAEHRVPSEGCACGIHAARSVSAAAPYVLGRNDAGIVHRVIGLVALWGRVFEGLRGWRAAYAYPAQLWVPPTPEAAAIVRSLRVYGARVAELPVSSPTAIAAVLART
jgi:hypothetical protein